MKFVANLQKVHDRQLEDVTMKIVLTPLGRPYAVHVLWIVCPRKSLTEAPVHSPIISQPLAEFVACMTSTRNMVRAVKCRAW